MIPHLSPSDLIYICAPAKAIDPQSVAFAQQFFLNNGFEVEIGKHALGQKNYFSGTEQERLDDLQKGLNHTKAKAILCARGGYGCMQLLEKLDWTCFQQQPKHLIGFSDITALHLEINQMRLSSLHATMPLNFEENTTAALQSLLSALSGQPQPLVAPKHPKNQIGEAKGEVVGGNLAMIHALLTRTPARFFKNKLLFIEDVGEHLYQIDRMLYGLQFAKILDEISGLIIGGFNGISDTQPGFGSDLETIILRHVSKNIPVGFGFPCGHQPDNQTVVFAADSKLTVTKNGAILEQQYSKTHP